MSEVEQIWEDLSIAEHRDEALKWAEDAFPQFLGNEPLVAQLYFTNVLKKTLPPPVDIITVGDLLDKFKKFEPVIGPDGKESKIYATIEVLMVQMLDDSRGYFGCPTCFKKVDRTIGFCTNPDHPGEEPKGVSLTFQKWQAGDNTGSIIVSFGPSSHQKSADTVNYTLTIQGSMNNRDGTFGAWEIVNKKPPKRLRKLTSLKKEEKVEPEPELEVAKDEEPEDEIFEDPEAATASIFGEEDAEGEEKGISAAQRERLIRSFTKLLKTHYTKKPNTTTNIVNWLSVQPQFKPWERGPEREAAVKEFLDELEAEGMFAYQDDAKETILATLEG